MPKRKHVKRVHMAPRTDANQGVREHNERVRKQNEYIIRKIAEYKAKQQQLAEQQRMMAEPKETTVVDGLQDPANE